MIGLILVLCCVGAYATNNRIFDAFFFVAIGVLVWTVMKELKAYKIKKQSIDQ